MKLRDLMDVGFFQGDDKFGRHPAWSSLCEAGSLRRGKGEGLPRIALWPDGETHYDKNAKSRPSRSWS